MISEYNKALVEACRKGEVNFGEKRRKKEGKILTKQVGWFWCSRQCNDEH